MIGNVTPYLLVHSLISAGPPAAKQDDGQQSIAGRGVECGACRRERGESGPRTRLLSTKLVTRKAEDDKVFFLHFFPQQLRSRVVPLREASRRRHIHNDHDLALPLSHRVRVAVQVVAGELVHRLRRLRVALRRRGCCRHLPRSGPAAASALCGALGGGVGGGASRSSCGGRRGRGPTKLRARHQPPTAVRTCS
eukprot:SAG31_NODE_8442_length_1451_cov_2.492604_1_plen_194_part_00